MKRIQCGDLVPGCTFKAQADSEAEVVGLEVRHAREAHGITVNEAFVARARERVEDVPETSRPISSEARLPGLG